MNLSFWRNCLLVVSIYHVIFGVVLALFSQSAFMDVLLNQYFDPIFWPDDQITPGTLQYKGWVSGVLGSVIASWCLLIAFLAYYPFNRAEKWAWTSIAVTVLFWFIIDTACSLYYHVPVNVIFNLLTLLMFSVPLIFSRKYFFG